MLPKLFILTKKKHFEALLKENKTFSCKKFVKISHKQIGTYREDREWFTCSWQVFTNSESTDPRFFLAKTCFLLNVLQSVFFVKINSYRFYLVLKQKKKNFVKKIRRFRIRENKSRICYCLRKQLNYQFFPLFDLNPNLPEK